MTLSIIDTHAHLDMWEFDKDRPEVVRRAVESGVAVMVNPAVDLKSSENIVRLSETEPRIFAAVGCHPSEGASATESDIRRLAGLLKHPKVVAVGEAGLDFYRNRAPREKQFEVLKWQLELAGKTHLPIIIHSRESDKEMTALLQTWAEATAYPEGRARGVIHCYNGDTQTLKKYLSLGFYIAFGGYITYPSSGRLMDVIKAVPIDRLVVETDCPYLPPQPHRGERNEPSYLPLTIEQMAKARNLTPKVMAEKTTENARCLFRLPRDW